MFGFSPGNFFNLDSVARRSLITSSLAAAIGLFIDVWFIFAYSGANVRKSVLVSFLCAMAWAAWPTAVLVMCVFAGVFASLQPIVYGFQPHRAPSRVNPARVLVGSMLFWEPRPGCFAYGWAQHSDQAGGGPGMSVRSFLLLGLVSNRLKLVTLVANASLAYLCLGAPHGEYQRESRFRPAYILFFLCWPSIELFWVVPNLFCDE